MDAPDWMEKLQKLLILLGLAIGLAAKALSLYRQFNQ
jgi:hypothetical protein